MKTCIRKTQLSVCLTLTIFTAACSAGSYHNDRQSALPHSADAVAIDRQLLVVGGSMNLCSSLSTHHCTTTAWLNDDMRQDSWLELSAANVNALADALEDFSIDLERASIVNEIAAIKEKNDSKPLIRRSQFATLIDTYLNRSGEPLSDREWYFITDYLEHSSVASEVVSHQYAKMPYGTHLIDTFVAMARHARQQRLGHEVTQPPTILVVTASARDSYDAIDYYESAFSEAGAHTAWLPIDAPLYHAIQSGNCDQLAVYQADVSQVFNRQAVALQRWQQQQEICHAPQRLIALLEDADGVFINGGDQSLTRAAFVDADNHPSPWLTHIHQRLQASTLALGGTSAGAAVQPQAPMISNGSSERALLSIAKNVAPPERDCERNQSCPQGLYTDSLTFNAAGGIGVFPFGLVDTHFSERHRQARIIALGADTDTPLAMGVDETTGVALNIHNGALNVVGQHGVFFATNMRRIERTVSAETHYLLRGSSATLNNNAQLADLRFGDSPAIRPAMNEHDSPNHMNFVNGLNQWCAQADRQGKLPATFAFRRHHIATRIAAEPRTEMYHHAHGCQVSYLNAQFEYWSED